MTRTHRCLTLLLTLTLALAATLIPTAGVAFAATGPWTAQSAGTSQALNDVTCVDANAVWVVGGAGTILHTANAGSTWQPQSSGTTETLRSVALATGSAGWAVGDAGVIVHTANGGTSWTPQSSATSETLRSVSFIDAHNGWAVGDAGTILHTADGGATWGSQSSEASGSLRCVVFKSAQDGWIVGDGGTILNTADGGVTWTRQASGTTQTLSAVTAVTLSAGQQAYYLCWAVGENGTIVSTSDGGSHWYPRPSGTTAGLLGVTFVGTVGGYGWAVGNDGTVVESPNSGGKWVLQPANTTKQLSSVTFSDPQRGWLVGEDGTILRYVDTAPPITTIGSKPSGWVNHDVTISLTATDAAGGSGVANILYGFDAPATQQYTGPVVISSEGEVTVNYCAVDRSGNREQNANNSVFVQIDKTAPITMHDNQGTYTHPAEIELDVTDVPLDADGNEVEWTVSDVKETRYRLDKKSGVFGADSLPGIVKCSAAGRHTLSFSSVDHAGNHEATQTTEFTVYGKTSFSLSTKSSSPSYGARSSIAGKLSDAAGGVSGLTVKLQSSANGKTFKDAGSAKTKTKGAFSFTVSPSAKTTYRLNFAGSGYYVKSASKTITIDPKVSLSTPSAPSTASHRSAFSSVCYLKPRHKAAIQPVNLLCYHYERGSKGAYVWTLRKTFAMKSSNYSNYTKLTGRVTLPAGKWRMRAYHRADALNAKTYSAWRYVSSR